MKKILACILLLSIITALFGCGNENKNGGDKKVTENYGTGHKIYIREGYSDKITATFFSTESDEKETVDLKLLKKGDDYNTYCCSGDTEKYDRVIFTGDDTDKSMELAFNDFVNGYHLTAGSSQGNIGIPFVYDEEEKTIDYTTVSLKYNKEVNKKIFVWVPEGYDKKDKETKYSVMYMCDGQNLFDKNSTTYGCWNVAESVMSMMANSSNRCIVVGIDDGDGNRDSELTPNLGKVRKGDHMTHDEFENGTGKEYSDFVINTVMPYINKNYNVYTDREHTSVCGSSSGGIEAFYIGMEHPDKISSIGALSPAFLLYGDDVWNDYLKGLKFDGNEPLVYIYNGEGDSLETSLMEYAKKMPEYLENINYPQDKVIFKEYKEACHNEHFWRAIFPDFLKYAFEGNMF